MQHLHPEQTPRPITLSPPKPPITNPGPSRTHKGPPQSEKHDELPAPEDANRETPQPTEKHHKFITSISPTVVYIAVLLVFFVSSLEQQTSIACLGVIINVTSAAVIPSFSHFLKLGDYLFSLLFTMVTTSIGFVVISTCKTSVGLGVGQLICSLGYQALFYVLDVITCDISSLENRAWLLALSRFPYIINTFVGPNLAQKIHQKGSWRLAYGIFGAILPAMCIPLAIILCNESFATAKTRLTRQRTHSLPPFWKHMGHIVLEIDIIGMLIFAAASGLLITLSVSSSVYEEVNAPKKTLEIVAGVLFSISFLVWEVSYARHRFAAFHLLINPTVLGACLAGAALFISFHCLDAYFLSYIQVVYNVPISRAGYIYNIHTIGACFFAILGGISIRATGKFKWLALSAIAWHFIATGLLFYFRQPKRSIAHIVVSQLMISVSGGLLGICGQMAILAADTHTEPATVLSLLFFFTTFGAAVGQTIASAIYTFHMPTALNKYLPADVKPWGNTIYRSLIQQLSYPMASPIRQAVIKAYNETMRHLCMVGLCVLPVALLSIVMWQNFNVKKGKPKEKENIATEVATL